MKHVTIAALAVALSGCALKGHFQAYEGPLRPDAEHARVLVPYPGNPLGALYGAAQIRISCVDGKYTSKFFGYNSPAIFEQAPEVLVTPGHHNVTLAVKANNLSGHQTVWFDAEPGHTYYVRHEVFGGGFGNRYLHVQVQDKDSSQLVSHVMDKEPDPKDNDVAANLRCRA